MRRTKAKKEKKAEEASKPADKAPKTDEIPANAAEILANPAGFFLQACVRQAQSLQLAA